MFIRPVELQDRKKIRQIIEHEGTFNENEVRVAMEVLDEALRYPKKGDYHVFCATDDSGSIAGYICFGPIPLTDGSYDLYWIVVAKEFSRKGVGRELLIFMEEFLARKRARQIYVDTASTQAYEPARSFYKKNGYRVVCVLHDFYRKDDDKVVFVKEV